MKLHIISILGILFFTSLFIFCAYVVEPIIFETYFPLNLPDNLEMDDWIISFQQWALVCVGAALIGVLIWYGSAQNVFKGNNEKTYGKRGLWGLLFLFPMAAVCVSILMVEQAESSLWLAYIFFIVNGLFPYWLATALFSPVSVKYTPFGSKQMRRLWEW